MPKREEGTLSWLRGVNRERLVDALRRSERLSQADLARLTGLSRTTVSSLVAELKGEGLVREVAVARPGRRGGRPALQLMLEEGRKAVVGIDFGHSHVLVAIAEPGPHILAERSVALDVDHDARAALDTAARLVDEVISAAGLGPEGLIGVGMGVPGPVDRARGTVGSTTILPAWTGLHIADEIGGRLGRSVEIDNDANLGALAELMWGAGRGCSDFVYIKVATGVGAGLVVDGRPLRGVSGTAGEIGHLTLDEGGALCYCGNRGCLETLASGASVQRLVNADADLSHTLTEIIDLALAGDVRCRRAITDAGREIGIAVAGVCNLLNPQRVIVGGALSAAGPILLDPMRASLHRHAVLAAAQVVEVAQATFGERAELMGALALALHESRRPTGGPAAVGVP
ncbi:MAG TPA: ROK family transcriptional regulator [Candidatus Dormibacteraeota bacterium]